MFHVFQDWSKVADGKSAYVSNFGLNDAENRNGTPGDTVSVIDIEHARVRAALRLPHALKAPHGLGFRPQHSRELFVNAEQGDRMVVFDALKNQVKPDLAYVANVGASLISGSASAMTARDAISSCGASVSTHMRQCVSSSSLTLQAGRHPSGGCKNPPTP